MYLGREHVEIKPSCPHELVTFLKYHIPLYATRNINSSFVRNSYIYSRIFYPSIVDFYMTFYS